jgi:hypothetical protein
MSMLLLGLLDVKTAYRVEMLSSSKGITRQY